MEPKPPRRKKPPPKRRPGEDAAKLDRTAEALKLRIAGYRYREIGALLGVTGKTAYFDVQAALGELDEVVKEKAERLRELEGARADWLWLKLEAGITQGDPRAILAGVRVIERRAKLFGLDAPQQIEGPVGGALPIRIVLQQDKG